MANVYTELFYHFVWTTKDRQPLITPEIEPHLFRQLRTKCAELKVLVHALNGTPDHLHLACTVPATLAVAEVMERLKGSSSHFLNHREDREQAFRWQEGYGVLTFAKRELPRIVAYIDGQKHHHSSGELSDKMERSGE